MKTLKARIFRIIEPTAQGHEAHWGRIVDATLVTMILASIAALFLGTFNLPSSIVTLLLWVEWGTTLAFTGEYILRLWTSDLRLPHLSPGKARWQYVRSGLAIIDLLAILPFWLTMIPFIHTTSFMGLRILRLLRFLRLFKLNRYSDALRSICDVFRDKRHQLLASMMFVGVLIIIASMMMYAIEHEAQPSVFKNGFSAIWWAIVTLTTVGYGDIYPITTMGRLLGGIIALLGVGMVAIPTGILSAGFVEHLSKKRRETFDVSDREQLKQLLREVLKETSSTK